MYLIRKFYQGIFFAQHLKKQRERGRGGTPFFHFPHFVLWFVPPPPLLLPAFKEYQN